MAAPLSLSIIETPRRRRLRLRTRRRLTAATLAGVVLAVALYPIL